MIWPFCLFFKRSAVSAIVEKVAKETTSIVNHMASTGAVKASSSIVRANGNNLAWCPFTTQGFPLAKTRGFYSHGYPQGAVVHFTAGQPSQKIDDAVEYQVERGYSYFVIAANGEISQNFPLTHWGYHAGGKSAWKGIGKGVSNELVGIEIINAGKLSSGGVPWFGSKPYAKRLVRTVKSVANVEGGTYHKYTKAQEESLVRLLKWLHENNPSVFKYDYVLGHDEVSGKRGIGYQRKNDPGGALSVTMDELRTSLKNA